MDCGDDLEPSFLMAEFAGELEQTFVGLGTAIAEEDATGREVLDDLLGEAGLR